MTGNDVIPIYLENPSAATLEQKWYAIIKHRDMLLDKSTWTQLLDNRLTLFSRLKWRDYRESLTSIEDDFNAPESVIFPDPPAEE